MDTVRFDQLARTLTSSRSRRGIVRTLAGAALGGALATAGVAGSDAKGRCRAPDAKCGRGKTAQCCKKGSQICKSGSCVADNRTVALSFESFDDYHTHCYITASIADFAPGGYDGTIGWTSFTVTAAADGSGSWTSRSMNLIWMAGSDVEATVDGVSSGRVTATC
jgi:hypothetical protein